MSRNNFGHNVFHQVWETSGDFVVFQPPTKPIDPVLRDETRKDRFQDPAYNTNIVAKGQLPSGVNVGHVVDGDFIATGTHQPLRMASGGVLINDHIRPKHAPLLFQQSNFAQAPDDFKLPSNYALDMRNNTHADGTLNLNSTSRAEKKRRTLRQKAIKRKERIQSQLESLKNAGFDMKDSEFKELTDELKELNNTINPAMIVQEAILQAQKNAEEQAVKIAGEEKAFAEQRNNALLKILKENRDAMKAIAGGMGLPAIEDVDVSKNIDMRPVDVKLHSSNEDFLNAGKFLQGNINDIIANPVGVEKALKVIRDKNQPVADLLKKQVFSRVFNSLFNLDPEKRNSVSFSFPTNSLNVPERKLNKLKDDEAMDFAKKMKSFGVRPSMSNMKILNNINKNIHKEFNNVPSMRVVKVKDEGDIYVFKYYDDFVKDMSSMDYRDLVKEIKSGKLKTNVWPFNPKVVATNAPNKEDRRKRFFEFYQALEDRFGSRKNFGIVEGWLESIDIESGYRRTPPASPASGSGSGSGASSPASGSGGGSP